MQFAYFCWILFRNLFPTRSNLQNDQFIFHSIAWNENIPLASKATLVQAKLSLLDTNEKNSILENYFYYHNRIKIGLLKEKHIRHWE